MPQLPVWRTGILFPVFSHQLYWGQASLYNNQGGQADWWIILWSIKLLTTDQGPGGFHGQG